jgi:hypothetical protein
LEQEPPQFVSGGVQAAAQVPAEHTMPGAHAVVHDPQCEAVVMSTSHPSAALALQSAKPDWQAAMMHAPRAHAAVA